jgi:hypothetical protein
MRSTAVGLLLATLASVASATDLVGRVVDAVDARVFAGATVLVRGEAHPLCAAQTDGQGYFRMPGLADGSYVLDVALADGRGFVARLVLLPERKSQFVELDYSRAVPPDDDEDY